MEQLELDLDVKELKRLGPEYDEDGNPMIPYLPGKYTSDIKQLSEEIIDDKSKKYIYESPDGGKTIYRREFGKSDREVIKHFQKTINEKRNFMENSNTDSWSGNYEDFREKKSEIDESITKNLKWYEKWKTENFNNDDPVDKDRKRYTG